MSFVVLGFVGKVERRVMKLDLSILELGGDDKYSR